MAQTKLTEKYRDKLKKLAEHYGWHCKGYYIKLRLDQNKLAKGEK